MKISDTSAILFDFDGVLAESVKVKTDAFAALYEDYGPCVVKDVVAYHLRNGGISRYEKIRHYQTVILGQPTTEEEIEELASRFADISSALVVSSEWVPGARAILEEEYLKRPLFVVSGTPEMELHSTVNARGMAHFFQGVYGSPATKAAIIDRIITKHKFNPEKVIMIGDSTTDYDAVAEYGRGMCFVGRVAERDTSPFPDGTPLITDLSEISFV